MPRIRTIKPEAPQHRKVGPLSDRAFRVWLVLVTQADDEGRVVAEPSQVRLWAFGYHPDVTLHDVEDAIYEVAKPGLIRLYSAGDTRYACFPSWKDHQRINRPTPSKLPEPPRLAPSSMSPHGILIEDSLRTHAGSDQDQEGIGRDQGSEGIGRDRRGVGNQGEPDGARSASPLEAAPLAPVSDGEPAREPQDASKGNGKDFVEMAARRMPILPPEPGPIDKAKTERAKEAMWELIERAKAEGP